MPAICQTDTTTTYFTKDQKECTSDSAYVIFKSYFDGQKSVTIATLAKSGNLHIISYHADKERRKPIDSTRYFRENGTPHKTVFWSNGKPSRASYFYEDGKISGEVIYHDVGHEYRGWDTNGVLLEGYVVEKEATFPRGLAGWVRYLEGNLNANVAARHTRRAGNYTVKLGFIVQPDGSIKDLKPLNDAGGCEPCIKEAIRVLRKGPRWNPAMLNNKPVEFQAVQFITFQVI